MKTEVNLGRKKKKEVKIAEGHTRNWKQNGKCSSVFIIIIIISFIFSTLFYLFVC